MKSKKIIFIILAILLLFGIGFWIVLKTDILTKKVEVSNNQNNNEILSVQENSRDFVFVGDEGYLVKGKLLDEKFRNVFDKLPDTLYQLEFDDRIYEMEKDIDVNQNSFSLVKENTEKNLSEFGGTGEQENLIKYLKLVANGKATYPKISSPENLYQCLVTTDEFNEKYKDYFIETTDNYGMSNLPNGVKQKIIEFYNSDEGKSYRYKIKGNQTSTDLIWKGALTDSEKKKSPFFFATPKAIWTTVIFCSFMRFHQRKKARNITLFITKHFITECSWNI